MLLHALHCLYRLHESLSTTKYGLKQSKLCSTNVYKRHKSMQILSFRPHSSNSEQTLRLMKQSSPRPQCPKWAWIGPQKSEGKATQIPGFTGIRVEKVLIFLEFWDDFMAPCFMTWAFINIISS